MGLERMCDIGGGRVVVRDVRHIYTLLNEILSDPEFHIVKVYDYIEAPQETGYRGVHIICKHTTPEHH